MTMRFLAGSAGMPAEWALAAEGHCDDDANDWIGRWWNWELRWRAQMVQELQRTKVDCIRRCWEPHGRLGWNDFVHSEGVLINWHWLRSLENGGGPPRLGSYRFPVFVRPCAIRVCEVIFDIVPSLNSRSADSLLLFGWYDLHSLRHCAGGTQTYFFSTCLLDKK